MKNLQIILGICVLCLTLTACGRYATPDPVPESGFPHNYPHE